MSLERAGVADPTHEDLETVEDRVDVAVSQSKREQHMQTVCIHRDKGLSRNTAGYDNQQYKSVCAEGDV